MTTVDEAEKIQTATLLNEWAAQARDGGLTVDGLWEVRRRIRAGELSPQPTAMALLVIVQEAIMVAKRWDRWPLEEQMPPAAPNDVSTLVGG